MSQPLVTVITPTYNRADYLPEVIQSVLSQGYERLEYIVLDDGSTDNTVSAVQPFMGTVHFESHANMGEARTVNKAFGLARGDLIFVVNSDDPLLPARSKLASMHWLAIPPPWSHIPTGDTSTRKGERSARPSSPSMTTTSYSASTSVFPAPAQ